jgi:hypothetical protein
MDEWAGWETRGFLRHLLDHGISISFSLASCSGPGLGCLGVRRVRDTSHFASIMIPDGCRLLRCFDVETQHTGVTTDSRLQRCRNWTVSYLAVHVGRGGGGLTSSHVLLPTAFVHVPTTCTRLVFS